MHVPKDGEYANWEVDLATRYPLALAEMSRPSAPLGSFEAGATARWGIECAAGWRPILVRLLDRLEAAIAAQPAETRDDFRIAQIKEKFGRLTVYLASAGTPAMTAAIGEAGEASLVTCEACGAPGRLAERRLFWSVKCAAHENWTPLDPLV
jgi:hypothetical protein